MTVEVAFFNAAKLLPAVLETDIRAGIDDDIAALRRHVDVGSVGIGVVRRLPLREIAASH